MGVLTSGSAANDFALANQGQAKNLALAAVTELDTDLAQFGGAGPALDSLANTLLTGTGIANDFAAINIGQAKTLAQPFYDRLLSLGYTGPPLTTGSYPWLGPGLPPPNDFAAINIGQLKYLFSFDPTYSATGDTIPDWWLHKYFPGHPLTSGSFTPWSNGQITLLQAYQQGLNPVDFYTGATPTLSIISGNNQTGAPGGFAPAPLIVLVSDSNAAPLAVAPVTFAITSGGGLMKKSFMTPGVFTPVTLLTDASGHATLYLQLPSSTNATTQLTATAGPPATPAQVTFAVSTDDGSGSYRSPFGPSNVIGNINADGSEDMTWQNNTDSPASIPIWYWNPRTQAWVQVDTVPAGTTSYHYPPNPLHLTP